MIWGAGGGGQGALLMQQHLGLRLHRGSFPSLARLQRTAEQAWLFGLMVVFSIPGSRLTLPKRFAKNEPGITLPPVDGSQHWTGAWAFLKNPWQHDHDVTSPLSFPFSYF